MGESVDIKACRLCLVMDCNLLSIDIQLENTMKNILGQNISYDSGLPKYACDECAQFLGTFKVFRDKCLKAQTVLYNMLKNDSQITDSEIRKLNRSRLKLDTPLSLPPPSTHEEVGEPLHVETSHQTLKTEPMDLEILSEDYSEEDDDVSLNDINPLEPITEEKRSRKQKNVKQEIKLEPEELDISEGFTISLPTTENIKTKTQSSDDEELPYHCDECCQDLANEDTKNKCPAADRSHTMQSVKKTGEVRTEFYLQFRNKENARKKRFLDKMTPEQKALKRKKDLEWYHSSKVDKRSEEEKAKRRECWKKSSQRYRQKKKERKNKGQVDSTVPQK